MRVNEAILRQLGEREIEDQTVLLALLRAEGFELTLSTLSRHLKKLGVRKERGLYRAPEGARGALPPCTLVRVPNCLLVLRTNPGFAGAVAVALDAAALPGIAGTVAGDDTLFVAPLDPTRLEALEADVRRWLASRT